MEAAWREHVDKLTLAQLSSAEACRQHINDFELQFVSASLGQTVLGSVDDVQEKIASMLHYQPHPDAQSMRRLANIYQSKYNAAIVKEMLDNVKCRTEQGYLSTSKC